MADQSTPVGSVDAYEQLNLVRNPDGTITRKLEAPEVPPTGDGVDADVFTKDLPLNEANNTTVRIYRPRSATKGSKLPIIVYYHGGGFILYRTASLSFHNLCVRMASELPAIVVSVDYRLAPEHRLPAAYDDGVEAVLWVKNQATVDGEPWLNDYADFSKCFVMGSSAGGNMVYYVGLRLWDLGVKTSGLILNQPFFGCVERTASEKKMMNDLVLPLPSSDLMWELSLPIGADRDHEYCNPIVKGLSESEVEALNSQGCLICTGGQDPLMDQEKVFVKMLEGKGVKVVEYYDEKSYHAMELIEPEKSIGLFNAIRDFIYY